MSSELAVVSFKDLGEAQSIAKTLSTSNLLSDSLRNKPQDVFLIILAGSELGFGIAQSVRAIEVIKGKPSLKAETMVALVKARKDICEYFQLVSSDAKSCTYETKRVGEPKPTVMTFDMADASTAGLLGGDGWKKYPKNLLRARCSSALCRAVYPDVTLGLYSTEEARDMTDVTEDVKFEYTPSTAPKESPPHDAPFTPTPEVDPLDEVLAKFRLELLACVTVAEMEALWKNSDKGSADQQARMTTAYRLRKAEIQPPKIKIEDVQPVAPTEAA